MSKSSTKTYNKAVVEESEHLRKYVSAGITDKHFSCSACKGSDRLWENLLIHVESEAHEKKISEDLDSQEKRKRAMLMLFRKGFRSKIGGYSEETLFPSAISSDNKDIFSSVSSAQKDPKNLFSSDKKGFENIVDQLQFELKHEKEELNDCRLAFQFEMSKFILENNLPFKITKALLDFLQKIVATYSAEVILNMSANKNDITRFAEAIGGYLRKKHLDKLAETKFSLALDGGKTSSNEEYLGVSARYFDSKDATTSTTKMIGLIPFQDSASGLAIKAMVEQFLFLGDGGEARRSNLVGIAADKGSNMISEKNNHQEDGAGVANRLKKETSHLIVTHDLCHSLNLVAQKCLLEYPTQYFKLVTKISGTFSRSAFKNSKFKSFLRRKKRPELIIPAYCETRWTSFVDTLEKILQSFDLLKAFFEEEEALKAPKKPRKNNNKIKKSSYFTKENQLMLQLLFVLMKKLTFYIKTFEKDNIETTNLVRLIKHSTVIIGEYMFKLKSNEKQSSYDSLIQILNLDEGDEAYQDSVRSDKEFNDYFLSKNNEFKELLNAIKPEKKEEISTEFFKNAKKFLNRAFESLRNRLPQPESVLMNSDCILLRSENDLEKLKMLAGELKGILGDNEFGNFNNEVERLEQERFDLNRLLEQHRGNPLVAWKEEKENFKSVYELIRILEILPYSSVSVERSFSGVGNIKTKKRNKLKVGKVEAGLLYKQDLKGKDLVLNTDILSCYKKICKKEDLNQDEGLSRDPKSSTMVEEVKVEGNKDSSSDISLSSSKEENFYKRFIGKLVSQMGWDGNNQEEGKEGRTNKRAPEAPLVNPGLKQNKKTPPQILAQEGVEGIRMNIEDEEIGNNEAGEAGSPIEEEIPGSQTN